jgi:hypothetical protein
MKREIKEAVFEWCCGLVIGMTPLLMHALLHTFVVPVADWADSWTGETLFVSITNSGLSVVTAFSRSVNGSPKKSLRCKILMVITVLVLLFSGALYGVVAAGVSKDVTIWAACFLLWGSVIVSIFFVIAIAK